MATDNFVLSEESQKVLAVINKAIYEQAATWIAAKLQMPYGDVKKICASLYAWGIISKQGNGRYK